LILNLTNDGWYGDSSAPYQHLAIARWRAIENRRFLLRAANSGVSAIIEPTGRIQTSTGILYEAVCKGRFEFIKQMTFYTCYGDVFVFVCVIIATGFFVMAIKRDQRPKKR
jgi:apolipoprotein N-acyltransferase